jgi:UDP-galactopyranose mutase
VRLHTDYLRQREDLDKLACKIIYTGSIDAFYNYRFGELEYRSLSFETEVLEESNYQGNAVVNYTEYGVPYTRIIEHKHFEFGTQKRTVISKEYPVSWKRGDEPYYSVNDKKNNLLYARYAQEAAKESKVVFGGRLGKYQYYDMYQVVAEALVGAEAELSGCNYNKNIVV